MGTKGKITFSLLFIIVLTIVTMFLVKELKGSPVRSDKYYVWGFSEELFNIEPGQIPTEVTFTFKGLTHHLDNSSAKLEIFLVDNPNLSKGTKNSFVINEGDITGSDAPLSSPPIKRIQGDVTITNKARDDGYNDGKWHPLLFFNYHDNHPGKEDITVKLSEIDDTDSWVWDIFDKPFNFTLSDTTTISYTAGLLEFIDYLGNGTGVGILIDPAGNSYFEIDDIIMEVKIETYEGEYAVIRKTIFADMIDDNNAPMIL